MIPFKSVQSWLLFFACLSQVSAQESVLSFGVEKPASMGLKGGWPPQNLSKKAGVSVLDFSAQAPANPPKQKAPETKPSVSAPPKQDEKPPAPPSSPPELSPIPDPEMIRKPGLPKPTPAAKSRSAGSLYTLGPGDTVVFSLFNQNKLKRTVRIAPDGTVSYLQAIGVNADGLTVDQLRRRMEDELGQYKRNVRVIVNPVSIESKQFSIIGRVKKPGSFVLDRPTTVLEGIAKAEGVEVGTIRGSAFGLADFERSFVSRKGRKLDIDLAKLYHEGDLSQNAFLQPNDYLYVASTLQNEFYVLGAVNRPGRIKMPNKLTIASAIATAGGFADIGQKSKVLILRGNIHAPEVKVVDVRRILRGDTLDVTIQNRDIIFVPKRPFEILENAMQDALFTYMQTVTAEALNLHYTPFSL